MKKIIVANWKMNPQTLAEAEDLYLASSGAVVCPPFVYLEELSKLDSGVELGAQDISLTDEISQTGEISGQMLKQFGVKYVIIGHSDRRWKLGESDETVNKKLKSALASDLVPIVCLGEKTRDGDFKDFLKNQTESTFADLLVDQIQRCLVTYEPVWAISSTPGAKPDTPESALESVSIIQEILRSKFFVLNSKMLYGGSVDSENAAGFLSKSEISGILVGGASLNKEEFKKIIEISSNV